MELVKPYRASMIILNDCKLTRISDEVMPDGGYLYC